MKTTQKSLRFWHRNATRLWFRANKSALFHPPASSSQSVGQLLTQLRQKIVFILVPAPLSNELHDVWAYTVTFTWKKVSGDRLLTQTPHTINGTGVDEQLSFLTSSIWQSPERKNFGKNKQSVTTKPSFHVSTSKKKNWHTPTTCAYRPVCVCLALSSYALRCAEHATSLAPTHPPRCFVGS